MRRWTETVAQPVLALFVICAGECFASEWSQACKPAEVLFPAKGSVVSEPFDLVWKAFPDVARYRVQIEFRVPNAGIVGSNDIEVEGTRFSPQIPLSEHVVAVKVLVTAPCAEATRAAVSESGPTFFLDARHACAAPANVSAGSAPPRVEWDSSRAGIKTEVFVVSASSGKLLLTEEVQARSFILPAVDEPILVAVRHRCPRSVSRTVIRVLTSLGG